MTSESNTHPHDDLAAYAVDALEADERASVDDHLAVCPTCRRELDAHLDALADLSADLSVDEAPPPPAVWDGILDQIRRGSTNGQPGSPSLPAQPSLPASPSSPQPVQPQPRHLGPGGPHRASRSPWFLAAAATVVALAAAAGVVVWAGRDDGTADVAELAAEAASDPEATNVDLLATDGSKVAQVVLTQDAADYVIFDQLPELPEGRAFQLWNTGSADGPVSLGVVGDGSSGAAQLVLPATPTSYALSEEPEAGSSSPTGPIVASSPPEA